MKLLHIIAAPRGERSRTLQISNAFLAELKAKHASLHVDELDLFTTKLPEVSVNAADAKYTSMMGMTPDPSVQALWEEITSYSKSFVSYDYYLITNPMWNFSIPYMLKHYIDVIMQAGILFSFTEAGVQGMAVDKKMFCITSRGSDYSPGSYMHAFDHQEPYLRSIFGLAGIHDITFLHAQPLDMAPGITQDAMAKALDEAKNMAANANL